MAKKKKAAKRKAAKKKTAGRVDVCPECKGERYGRGYKHKATCSKKSTAGNAGKRRGDATVDSVTKALKVLTPNELLQVRENLDSILADKQEQLLATMEKFHKVLGKASKLGERWKAMQKSS